MRRLFILITLIIAGSHTNATSIVPFIDLGETADVASDIYVVRAGGLDSASANGITLYFQSFEIIDAIKGSRSGSFEIKRLSRKIDGLHMTVAGDIDYEEGDKYLLFLRDRGPEHGLYPACSSYYIYNIEDYNKREYAIPMYADGSLHIAEDNTTEQKAHRIFELKQLKKSLANYLTKKQDWSQRQAEADATVYDHFLKKYKNNHPSYCGYLSGNTTHARWRNMETQALPVYYQLNGDGCSNISTQMNNTINYLNTNYTGIDLAAPISRSGYNNCSGGIAYNGLPTFMNNTFGDTRRVYIQFSDPCNEIANLVNCGGTLGYGGSFWGGSYTSNGTTYFESSVGFVVVNDGVANCYCGSTTPGRSQTNFVLFMAHELTHVLGLNHISASNGSALINPSCCNDISSLDLACIEHLYPPSGANCTHTNRTYNNTNINSQTVLANNAITTINTVNINNGANINWNAENRIEINGPFQVPNGATLTANIDDCQ